MLVMEYLGSISGDGTLVPRYTLCDRGKLQRLRGMLPTDDGLGPVPDAIHKGAKLQRQRFALMDGEIIIPNNELSIHDRETEKIIIQ